MRYMRCDIDTSTKKGDKTVQSIMRFVHLVYKRSTDDAVHDFWRTSVQSMMRCIVNTAMHAFGVQVFTWFLVY